MENMNKYSERFDERQKLVHGKAVLYGYICLAALMLIGTILRECGVNIISNFSQYFLSVILSLLLVEMIIIKNDALDGIYDNYGRLRIIFNFILGLIIITTTIISIIKGSIPMVSNGMISDEYCEILIGLCLFIACAAYFIKKLRVKKTAETEE
ncbi:MAG: hypothetical protein KBI01_03215 [Oscillospiraceae bacterium]|nr:hypothetical protein [Oscillospiraceae bacterium]